MGIFVETFSQMQESLASFLQVIGSTWFFILPIPGYYLFKNFWLDHINESFGGSIDKVLLEITPPRDIEKSPKPMEALYVGMAGVEKGYNVLEKYVDGQIPFSFSLELVSDGGDVHFYIRTPKNFRGLIESHLYAQYPDAIITEVPDYIDDAPKVVPNSNWDLWGSDLEFVKDDAYPIKSYTAFEEDITGKMIDPLAGVIETMGKVPSGQRVWFQIIAAPLPPSWSREEGMPLVKKLKGEAEKKEKGVFMKVLGDMGDVFANLFNALWGPVEFSGGDESKAEEQPLEFRLSPGERDVLKAVENNLGKIMFSVKMRFVLLGKRDNFDKSNVSAFFGAIKQFNDDNLNSLKPDNTSKTYANFIFKKSRLRNRQRKIFKRYKDRDRTGVKFTMSTEELATIYHLPDMSVVAPTLARVDSKRGGAPANLPVQ